MSIPVRSLFRTVIFARSSPLIGQQRGDLIIKVIEYDLEASNQDGDHLVLKTASFTVSHQKLLDNCDSAPFKAMQNGAFLEGRSSVIALHDDSVASIELWLRRFYDAFNNKSYEVPILEVWNAIGVGRKYLFHGEKLNEWFAAYYNRQNVRGLELDDLKEWLYPCKALDHPKGFAFVTKTLVYQGTGHIQEKNPSRYRELHVEGRVIQQLNAARGSMRKEIIKGLFNPLERFCGRKCAAQAKSVMAYLNALIRTGVWPIYDLQSKSNKAIIESPGFVNWTCTKPDDACMSCFFNLSGQNVTRTSGIVLGYWNGLCLDCMDISDPHSGDLDDDYWRHNDLMDWGDGCRLNHERNTWYFSFMGRSEIMSAFNTAQQDRKKAREASQRGIKRKQPGPNDEDES
ncbi:hypothetical protein WAI453_008334 [Rhynchosporium graminicola]|uniref:Uncharacterized protein n=1 Tax=Rhynchosporium graminicola TaxID=2792576 RepID=A0A1E1KMC4_9HELO|nr:uncharacterized protein RCO7_00485 [Rhynchosporium commune]